MEQIIKNKLIEFATFYSVIIFMFLGLVVPFVWSYAKNLLDQLYVLKENLKRKHYVFNEDLILHCGILYQENEKKIKRFFYSMDIIVYSGSIYAVCSFGIALSILGNIAFKIKFLEILIFCFVVLNFSLQYFLFCYISFKDNSRDRKVRKCGYNYSRFLFSISVIYSWGFCKYGLRCNNFDWILLEMFSVIIIYLLLTLIPPITDRPVTALNTMRGITFD